MSYLGSWAIDDVLYFYANTTKFDTGVATDADAEPTYRVYENETGTALLNGTLSLIDSGNTAGFYSEAITLSAANGFELGKQYVIYKSATVNSVVGATHDTFQIGAKVNTTHLAGTAQTAADVGGIVSSGAHGNAALKTLIDAIDDFLDTEIAAILADTGELQTDWANGGRLDLLIDAIKAKTDALPADPADASDIAAAIAALNDLSAAEVNAEVVDALATDTYAEPTGVPGATVSLAAKINRMYMIARNGFTITATEKTFLDDGGAAEWKRDLSDDGSTYTEGESTTP